MHDAPDGLWNRRRIWAVLADVPRELALERGWTATEESVLSAVLCARRLVREADARSVMPRTHALAGLDIGGDRVLTLADVEAAVGAKVEGKHAEAGEVGPVDILEMERSIGELGRLLVAANRSRNGLGGGP